MLNLFPSDVLGEILEYLASPTVFTLWICGDKTLQMVMKSSGAVKRFGLHYNLQIKPNLLSFPSIILNFRHIYDLRLVLTASFRAKPIVSGFDFEKLPTTLRKLKLNFLQIVPTWQCNVEAGFSWSRKFPSLLYLDIETDGSMTSELYETLPPYLDFLRLKLSVSAGRPEHMALLPKELHQLYLEDPGDKLTRDIYDTKFPDAITDLALNVKWALSCSAYPPTLNSFSVTFHGPPINSLGRLPPTLKFLSVNILLPLELHLIPLLPRNLEYLEWYPQNIDQACVYLLPKSLTRFCTKILLLPPNLIDASRYSIQIKSPLPSKLSVVYARTIDPTNVHFLPPELSELTVSSSSPNIPIPQLPNSLTSLRLYHDAPLSKDQVLALPKNLTLLHFRLSSEEPWRAESFPPNIVNLSVTGAVDQGSIESLEKLKKIQHLYIYSYRSNPILSSACIAKLPKLLLCLHMPYTGDLTASELQALPPCLTFLSFASHSSHTLLTLQDYQSYWPSFLFWACIPPYPKEQSPPSKTDLLKVLSSHVGTIKTSQGGLFERPTPVHSTIDWEEGYFRFLRKPLSASDLDSMQPYF